MITTDALKGVFNGHEVKFNYDDGKEMRIMYSRWNYVSIPIDECVTDADIKNRASQYKRVVLDLINLLVWLKKEPMLGEKINSFLLDYFKIEVNFSVKFDELLTIKYMDKEIVLDPHKIGPAFKQNDVVTTILHAASVGKRSWKHIEQNLPKAITDTLGSTFDKSYVKKLESSAAWRRFEDNMKDLYCQYNDFTSYMRKDEFLYLNESFELDLALNLSHSFNAEFYKVTHSNNGIKYYLDGKEIFHIEDDVIESYNTQYVETLKKVFLLISRMHYDLAKAIGPYSRKNICFRLKEDGSLSIHSYSKFKDIESFNDAYDFVKEAKELIDKAVNYNGDKRIIDIINANDIGCLYQCMNIYGRVNYDSYITLCKCRGILSQDAMMRYTTNIESLISRLQAFGIIEKWSILSSNSYELQFTHMGELMALYDCVEAKKTISLQNDGFSFEEAINLFPRQFLHEFLHDKDCVYNNTKVILDAMDNHETCKNYWKDFLEALPYINEKYLPLLKLKAIKSNSIMVMGKNFHNMLTEYLNNLDNMEKKV